MVSLRPIAIALLSLLTLSGTDDCSWTPLQQAVKRGDAKAVRKLVEFQPGGLNARGPGGMTALILAASTQPAMVAPLLDPTNVTFEGVEIDPVDDEGRDALIHAVRAGNFAVATVLAEAEWGTVKTVDRTGRSAFDYAVQTDSFAQNDIARVRFLENVMWSSPPFHGWGKDGTRHPPTIAEVAHDLCAKKLAGWDLRARLAMVYATVRDRATDADKRNVLLCAARAGIDLGAFGAIHPLDFPENVVDDRGYTPRMIMALESGKPLPPRTDLSAEISYASTRGLEEVATALVGRNTGSPSKLGNALLGAAKRGQATLVERLVAAGAPVEGAAESHYESPLAAAAAKGCRPCVSALLAADASLYPGSHPSEWALPQLATDETRPLIEAAMKARRPDAARLAEEERQVAIAAFAALLEKQDRGKGVFLSIRNVLQDKVDPTVPGLVPTINLEGFLWTSPAKVRTMAARSVIDTRPHTYSPMFWGSGTEVVLEKREGKWIVINVRRAWIE